jgi:hypothetical protein
MVSLLCHSVQFPRPTSQHTDTDHFVRRGEDETDIYKFGGEENGFCLSRLIFTNPDGSYTAYDNYHLSLSLSLSLSLFFEEIELQCREITVNAHDSSRKMVLCVRAVISVSHLCRDVLDAVELLITARHSYVNAPVAEIIDSMVSVRRGTG